MKDDDSRRLGRMRLSGKAAQDSGKQAGWKLTAGVPLAKLIKPRLVAAPELPVHSSPHSVAANRFGRLAAILEEIRPEPPRVVVVASPARGEGRSFTAINLALALTERSSDVLLLDADLRRPPAIATWLDPAPRLGLAELLAGRTELAHVLLELRNSDLQVLPSGAPPRDPLELLTSAGFEELMAAARERFERIVIDTPPIVPYSDADLVARFADRVIFVARAGQTRQSSLAQGLGLLTSTPVVGTVVNDVTQLGDD